MCILWIGTVRLRKLAFVEAIRLFGNRGRKNCLYINVVYVPWINTSKELKTKPAQNALKDLRVWIIQMWCVEQKNQRLENF